VEEVILKELAHSGPWGAVTLVLIKVIVHLYRKVELLQDRSRAELEALSKRYADEQATWQRKSEEMNLSVRQLAESLSRKIR
jgi:hypothetical protein